MPVSPADLDGADRLSAFRDRFVIDDDLVAYLDGNSLGRLPKATQERLAAFVREEWGGRLIRGWSESWVDLPVAVGDELGAALLGAASGQTVIADSTSVNLYKLLHAAAGVRPGRDEIVIDVTNFPTDRYLVESVASARGMTVRWLEPDLVENVTPDVLATALGERTAVVVLSHVDYRSGTLLDLPGLTDAVHAAGGVVVWDLCHSAGVVPIALDAAAVDFAVGCTYKYVNAGPGAPAFAYVAARHLADARQPIAGWWSAADLFAMSDTYETSPTIRRMLSGTPSVSGILAVQEGVRLIAEAGVDAIRAKSEALTAYAIELLDAAGLEIVTPREPGLRGSHVTVRHAEAREVAAGMIERGVVPDFREPDLIRLGLSPLSTSYAEVAAGVAVLVDCAAR
ncbi:kynureninase [Aeromicrobium chenweiae]|uniref:Kynureninase n=1 Tax=Aeromicrobium chenweiae TaxID=2079793 RepID=A0A2S0WN21_9ACTN|nr:kynureninase [Aeromicrobium chenweiae]AWB92749.1 kynureninase [Aeromicrobium chenweiae]TGN33741.1 kynureninase [Aeromicrobium chenweiae]